MNYLFALPKLKTFDIPLGVLLFDIIFIALIAWFVYRGMKKGISSLYWLVGNVVGMLFIVTIFKATAMSPINDAIGQSIDISQMPLPEHIFVGFVDTVLGMVIATVGLLVLNIILFIIWQFFKKKVRRFNTTLPIKERRIIGGAAGLALGVFVSMSLVTPIYAPIWTSYNENLDNSIAVRMTGGMHGAFYNAERTVSIETFNGIVDSIKAITDAEITMDGSMQGVLDLINQADKDPILGPIIDDILDSALDTVELPGMGSSVAIDIDSAYTILIDEVFTESTPILTTEQKVDQINAIFGWTGTDALDPSATDGIPNFSDDIAKRLACTLLTDDAGLKPTACSTT